MRFVAVGEPSIKASECVVRQLGGLVTYEAMRSKHNQRRTKLASHERLYVYESELLKKPIGVEEFTSHRPDWLTNTNCTIIFGRPLIDPRQGLWASL